MIKKVSKRAKAIIGLLFRDYWATDEQKDKIIRKQNYDRQLLEEKKKSMYDVENIFKRKSHENEDVKEMVVYKEQRWYQKLFAKILKIFKK